MVNVTPEVYQCMAIAKAMKVWRLYKIKVNRDYTPKNMLAMANKLTNKNFRPCHFERAEWALIDRALELQQENVHASNL
jgi:hypothetical protein